MIALLQPFVPHYREDFFNGISDQVEIDIFCYQTDMVRRDRFKESSVVVKPINGKELKGFLLYNPFTLLKRRYTKLVLMLNIGHLTTWLLLLFKFIHRKEIILWGHGISVKRYVKEESKPSLLMKWMIRLSDGVWFYTTKEQQLWLSVFPNLKSVALNNTISEVDEITATIPADRTSLRNKYNIHQKRVLIFCARFNIAERRIDLLVEAIVRMNADEFAFVIIGDGNLKPDFKPYKNVFDFGALYDREVKAELFQLADIYFQPGWVGLSVVEAMAYGKPVFSFFRSESVLQCVEYAYIQPGVTGILFRRMEDFVEAAKTVSDQELEKMGQSAKDFARKNLSMRNMVKAGVDLINN